jgi:DNA repair exonuclease SbcCD ATPase subunit
MLGTEDQIDKSYFLGDFDQFRDQILKLKEQLTSKTNGKGLTILDTAIPIYGTDYNGMRISSEADIIATDGTKIYVIDVRYSFDSPRKNWNIKFPKATFTIGEHVTRRVKQIEQIVNTKFKRGVNGLYCLPIIYDPSSETTLANGAVIKGYLSVDYSDSGAALMAIKPETADNTDESLETLTEAANSLILEINKNVDEYNAIAEEARKYSDLYQPIPHAEVQVFDSEQEYVNYINTIHAQYDTLQDRIDEMRTLINQRSNLYDEVWEQQIQTETVQQPKNYEQLISQLKDACSNLDVALNQLPDLVITTQTERDNVEVFIDALFDA